MQKAARAEQGQRGCRVMRVARRAGHMGIKEHQSQQVAQEGLLRGGQVVAQIFDQRCDRNKAQPVTSIQNMPTSGRESGWYLSCVISCTRGATLQA